MGAVARARVPRGHRWGTRVRIVLRRPRREPADDGGVLARHPGALGGGARRRRFARASAMVERRSNCPFDQWRSCRQRRCRTARRQPRRGRRAHIERALGLRGGYRPTAAEDLLSRNARGRANGPWRIHADCLSRGEWIAWPARRNERRPVALGALDRTAAGCICGDVDERPCPSAGDRRGVDTRVERSHHLAAPARGWHGDAERRRDRTRADRCGRGSCARRGIWSLFVASANAVRVNMFGPGESAPVSGPELFARYAYPPNELGYCGPAEPSALLEAAAEGGQESLTAHLARQFEGAWPYLELIAGCNAVVDPLDRRVVEAYWIGNDLN